ncbi:MAG: flagellar basal-body MS-ring/collar protein FliF [Terricaulis sp.]
MASETTPPRQWRLLAALFGTLLLALGAAYLFFLRQDYAVLYQDLREDDAAAITRALEVQHVRYRLGNGGADILVPAGDINQIRLDIAASDVAINGLEGFELFDQSDMGLTDFAQRIKYQRALQGELARTIMRMDGIVDARVHISIPERTLFRADRRNAEAAVTLVTRRAEDMTPGRVEGIQRLVAAAVTDLAPADVVVLDGRGQSLVATEVSYAPEIVTASDPTAEIQALAREAVHRAIPYRRFELQAEALTPSLEGPLADEGPESAPVPVALTLITEASLTQEERERVNVELTRAGFANAGDAQPIAFQVGPLRPPARPQATSTAAPNRAAPAASADGVPLMTWVWFAGAALLALICALLLWRVLRPNLSAAEQRNFADTLEKALEQDEEGLRDGV